MTNRELLNKRIKSAGIKKSYIAEALGKKPHTLSRKLAGTQDFTESEMRALTRILQLSVEDRMAIFFAEEVDKMATA